MQLDPQIRSWMDKLPANPAPDYSAKAVRLESTRILDLQPPPVPVYEIDDKTIMAGDGRAIPVRLYRHEGPASQPAIVFFHGGGFVAGSLATVDRLCRVIATASSAAVVTVDYRLSPENPYPAAIEDAWDAVEWLGNHGSEWGLDGSRLAVAGDSAGGTLAAVVALRARDAGRPHLKHQMLIYPAVDLTTASYRSKILNGSGYRLTAEAIEWYYSQYLPDRSKAQEPEASPILAELSGVAPATVITAGFDPLRDEGDLFAARLKKAGVPVNHIELPGMLHGFLGLYGFVDEARRCLSEIGEILGASLRDEQQGVSQ